jgi:hypothetical protein
MYDVPQIIVFIVNYSKTYNCTLNAGHLLSQDNKYTLYLDLQITETSGSYTVSLFQITDNQVYYLTF